MSGITCKDCAAVVLAAGKGTRMKTDLPKVLHEMLGKPMLWYILNTLAKMDFLRTFVVTGHGHELLENRFPEQRNDFIIQRKQLGTGHALQQAWPKVKSTGAKWLVAVNGDTPLVSRVHLEQLVDSAEKSRADLALLSLNLDDPSDYGRVVRDQQGKVMAVVEAKDYDEFKYGPCSNELNSGIYIFRASSLADIIFEMDADNRQKELYITQLISLACRRNMKVVAVSAGNSPELMGVNNPSELAAQEEYLRSLIVTRVMNQGVIIRGMDQVRIGPEADVEPGVDITGPCEIYGSSFIGSGTRIHSHCHIEDSLIRNAEIFSFSHIRKSVIKEKTTIGPFARLRPGTVMEEGAKAGNFVEIKNSFIGRESKVNHLSYIGDTDMGREVNIGAGTVTCNYDGREKHRTIIGEEVFIGSNTSLVAPVSVGRGSMVGAGSTITLDVPRDALAIARARQKNLAEKNPLKKS